MNYKETFEKSVITAIKCDKCGKLHNPKEETFITFYGNVCVGSCGGIIGNNLDDEMKVVKCEVYCRNSSCLSHLLEAIGIKQTSTRSIDNDLSFSLM